MIPVAFAAFFKGGLDLMYSASFHNLPPDCEMSALVFNYRYFQRFYRIFLP